MANKKLGAIFLDLKKAFDTVNMHAPVQIERDWSNKINTTYG